MTAKQYDILSEYENTLHKYMRGTYSMSYKERVAFSKVLASPLPGSCCGGAGRRNQILKQLATEYFEYKDSITTP